MDRTILIGFGNADRQDDGAAWHVMNHVAGVLGLQTSPSPEDGFEPGNGQSPELLFTLQLTPELSETISAYDRVCFIDAHTGDVPEEVHIEKLEAGYQASPFTHHMTPETCLALAEALFGRRPPDSLLVSVRGYEFGFERALSPRTEILVKQAAQLVVRWYDPELTFNPER